ncbi:MAG TPA: gamma-glutamylcyclotransferase [Stellaceae bacterium]|nr:gamma-glutamylcyclotransferase [Stellaceae bacterium]
MTNSSGGAGASLADAGPELWAKLSWESDLWIFAYGSLLWDPGFPYCDVAPAILHGHHRSFCVYSTAHRGTPERPGLVLGLDRGGTCKGAAYCVPAIDVPAALSYLWHREMKSRVYELRELEVQLPQRRVPALAFVVDRAHPHYAAGLSLAESARLIHQGVGASGTARGYFESALAELDRLGAIDRHLSRLAASVRALSVPERRAA